MRIVPALLFLIMSTLNILAEDLPSDVKVLVDKAIESITPLAADPVIVEGVKKYNAAPASTMTNDAWKKLTLLSPEVKALIKGDVGAYMKQKKTDAVTEMFLSGADGGKVAFLSKTTSWCHKGKAKHDQPMAGTNWIGPIEVDESSGAQQIQVALPVLDGGTPIGSLVVGFGIAQLKAAAAK